MGAATGSQLGIVVETYPLPGTSTPTRVDRTPECTVWVEESQNGSVGNLKIFHETFTEFLRCT